MSLTVRYNESVRAAIRRNARKRIDRALELLDAERDGESGDRIHEARKCLKQVRALVHLMRPEVGRKNCDRAEKHLQRALRALSAARDATVLRATLLELGRQIRLLPDSATILRSTLEYRLNRAFEEVLENSGQRKRLRRALHSARREMSDWTGIRHGWRAIAAGLEEIRANGRAASAVSANEESRSDETLHETRKRAKDLLHALEFVHGVDPEGIGEQIRVVHQFTESLGKDHDLAVMQSFLQGPMRKHLAKPELHRLLESLAGRRRALQGRAFEAARAVYGTDDVMFVRQIHRAWRHRRANRTGRSRQASSFHRANLHRHPSREVYPP